MSCNINEHLGEHSADKFFEGIAYICAKDKERGFDVFVRVNGEEFKGSELNSVIEKLETIRSKSEEIDRLIEGRLSVRMLHLISWLQTQDFSSNITPPQEWIARYYEQKNK